MLQKVVLPLGLPITSLPPFVEALANGNQAGLLKVPGVSIQILEAAVLETKQTYDAASRRVFYLSILPA